MPAKKVKPPQQRANGRWTACFNAALDWQTAPADWRSAGTWDTRTEARTRAKIRFEEAHKPGAVAAVRLERSKLSTFAEDVWAPSLTVDPNTKAGYLIHYRLRIKPAFGDKDLTSISGVQISTWIAELKAGGASQYTQRHSYIVLNLILKAARRVKPPLLVGPLPTEEVDIPFLPDAEAVIFQRREWNKFFPAVAEYWKPLVQVARESGLRASELRALRPVQINWGRSTITVDRCTVQNWGETLLQFGAFSDKAYPKGKRTRVITVPRSTLEVLAAIMAKRGLNGDSSERFFTSENDSRPFSGYDVHQLIEAATEKAGLTARRFSFKDLRSTCASWMLKDNGGNLVAVQQHLGHRSIETTENYLNLVDDDLGVDGDGEPVVVSFADFLVPAQEAVQEPAAALHAVPDLEVG